MSTVEYLSNLIAAAAAGLVGRLSCHPIDTCKAKLQSVDTFRGTYDVLSRTVRVEGVSGLYKGLGAVLVGGIPGVCVYMTSYEACKDRLAEIAIFKSYPALTYLTSGMVAEAVCCVLFVPVDVVKERLQVQSVKYKLESQYRGSYDALRTIVREEGLRGLYKGYAATVFSYGPYSAIYFLLYEELKNRLKRGGEGKPPRSDKQLSFWETLACSASAGSVASYVTNPLDLAKLRFQIQKNRLAEAYSPTAVSVSASTTTAAATAEQEVIYKGFIDALLKIYQQQGFKALFRGAWTRVLFFTPCSAITMASYEYFKAMFNRAS